MWRSASSALRSDLCLFGNFQGVVHLNAKVPDRRFKFAVNIQQIARLDDRFDRSDSAKQMGSPIVDAARRFVARGGTWQPDDHLLSLIEATALGRASCPRVRGSLIGGIRETQEMLDFCSAHNILSDIEMIRMDEIETAYARILKGDVRYRFVIDMATLATPAAR